MSPRRFFLLAAAFLSGSLLCAAPVSAQSAWLPPTGRTVATLSYAYKDYTRAWVLGATEFPVPPGGHQGTLQLNLQRSVLPKLAVDLAVGGTAAQFAGGYHSDGLADTELGVQATLLSHVPAEGNGTASTLAVRVAGVIPGSYEYAQFGSAGSQAGGVSGQLLGAVDLGRWHTGVEGSAGYLTRFSHRPDRWLGALGTYARLTPEITVSTTYRYVASLTGPDLFGPGFTFADFEVAHEVQHNLEGAVSAHVAGDTDATLFFARRMLGRNTEQAFVSGVGITRTF